MRVYNFSAGPSMLPMEVLECAAAELCDFNNHGLSVLEMSHRSKVFNDILQEAKYKLRAILSIPENYHIVFMQGGGTGQFSAVALNLMAGGNADYAITGNFSRLAAEEASKYGRVNIACSSEDRQYSYIPCQNELKVTPNASYFHYCSNNTAYGTTWKYIPETGGVPVVADMSSNFLSEPLDISPFSLIYAGAQKNMASAGLTLAIIRDDLRIRPLSSTPTILDYTKMIEKDSMPNTPATFNIYILNLMLDWIKKVGGLQSLIVMNQQKAGLLYDFLDNSSFYLTHAVPDARSFMNITFRTNSSELDYKFVSEAEQEGLINLRGHQVLGGLRASLFNAMPIQGVKKLIEFMGRFEQNYR
ncbi:MULTISPECIES: 3-phosphoserine/phosphohydroxythreonine transaminase [unclassified Maridesulfovibrio]|uniref:3-phosphoserine/phosphohydroxythreonine transaminase n=1 Tax=unclassified Maridesulfovibrio TaxID=2794999 RepID=UPI003B4227C2